MKEHPILFSSAMVQAILAGNKTMTRREGELKGVNEHPDQWAIKQEKREVFEQDGKSKTMFWRTGSMGANETFNYPAVVGDRLWVRETYQSGFSIHVSHCGYLYKATAETDQSHHGKWAFHTNGKWRDHYERPFNWRPSIFMIKAAARIWLEVTEVRVEHLSDISEEDAIAEGVKQYENGKKYLNYRDQRSKVTQFIYNCDTARQSFRTLWEEINGPATYRNNPWVWVVGFKVLSTTGKPE